MTVTERNYIVANWGGKYCPHPRFEDVDSGESQQARVCSQCGEFLDQIVSSTSHADFAPTSQSSESSDALGSAPPAPKISVAKRR